MPVRHPACPTRRSIPVVDAVAGARRARVLSHWVPVSMRLTAPQLLGILLLSSPDLASQEPSFPTVTLSASAARCTAIEPTPGGYRYSYQLANPSSSDAGIESFRLDIGAPLATRPEVLSTEGIFVGDATRNAAHAKRSHVPVGVITPGRWRAMIDETGVLTWWSPGSGLHATDPVRPGTARSGFAVTSPYLPGIAEYRLLPDYPHACCPFPAGDPRNENVEVRRAEDFQVLGLTLAAVYAPGQATIEILDELHGRACGFGWITNRGLCHSLAVKLDHAWQAWRTGNKGAASGHLRSYIAEIDAQHGPQPGKHVGPEAYMLLRTHAVHLLDRM